LVNSLFTFNFLCISLNSFSDDDFFIQVDFPFLVLLISGGHCLLAVVQAVDRFLLLGQSLDDAPGEAFDKVNVICSYLGQK
jgi:tRNA A37 threonylcarbamoyltransferase TsaD